MKQKIFVITLFLSLAHLCLPARIELPHGYSSSDLAVPFAVSSVGVQHSSRQPIGTPLGANARSIRPLQCPTVGAGARHYSNGSAMQLSWGTASPTTSEPLTSSLAAPRRRALQTGDEDLRPGYDPSDPFRSQPAPVGTTLWWLIMAVAYFFRQKCE